MTCVRADASRLDLEDRAHARSVLDLRGDELDLTGVVPALERLVARWRPSQVWLFGSRARGEATAESDWDLLVVVPDATPDDDLDPLVGWQLRKESRVRADLIPCREGDFRADRDTPNTLAHEAAHRGVLIYER
nr:nucleotidyltransferase domain-containing protein [Nannocystis pusilla]